MTEQRRARSAKASGQDRVRVTVRPRVVEPKLPMTDELTERDFARLEAAARRQLERNRRRIDRPRR